jgi:HK97 family phage portal protein
MGFTQKILDRVNRPVAQEKRSEWGSSAIPGPLAAASGGSFSAVNLAAMETGFQQVAVWGAVDLIASVASQLPIDTYKRVAGEKTPKNIPNPKIVEDPDGTGHGYQDWAYQYLVSKLARGNAYGRQELGNDGYPTQVVLYHPDSVYGWRDRNSGMARWQLNGKEVPANQMWHRRSYPMPGNLLGLSPIGVHATTVALGIAATRFGLQFFTDGAIPTGLLTNDETEIDQPTALEIKARWMAAVYGRREPAVYGKGWKYEQVSLKPEESQFLATNKYTSAQCARIYGPNIAEILGYETGGSMTYANVEQRSIDFLKFNLNRWLRDLETTISPWLPRGQFVKIKRAAILETDLLSRYKAYGAGIAGHFLAPSEVRDLEDMAPMTDEQKAELMALPAPVLNPLKESPK